MSFYKQVTSKPWEYQGSVTGSGPESAFARESEKIALTLFLVVVCVIFSLLTVTYYLRMDLGDWVPLADPAILWLNTAMLLLGSVAFQIARNYAQTERMQEARALFVGGGLFAWLFVAGQAYAWLQLDSNGLGVSSNPSSAFFFLLTGMHAVHLLGGLWVWSKTTFRLRGGKADVVAARLSIELCTTYWHFLLVLWLLLFWVLAST